MGDPANLAGGPRELSRRAVAPRAGRPRADPGVFPPFFRTRDLESPSGAHA